jgi:HemY protein
MDALDQVMRQRLAGSGGLIVAWVFLLGLAALVGGVGIVALIETEPGYLLIAYGGYTVETSFWVGILAIATLVLTFYAALRFLSRLIASPGSLLNWASARRLRQSSRLTTRGLVSFVEGNWRRARRQLLRGARYSEAPMLNYLIAARASYRLEEPEAMREYLAAASDSDVVDASIAVELTRAELLLHAQRYEEALTTLSDASKHASRNPYVFHLLSRAHEGLGDAEALVALMPELRRHQLRTVAELDALEDKVHRAPSRRGRDGRRRRAAAGALEKASGSHRRRPAGAAGLLRGAPEVR